MASPADVTGAQLSPVGCPSSSIEAVNNMNVATQISSFNLSDGPLSLSINVYDGHKMKDLVGDLLLIIKSQSERIEKLDSKVEEFMTRSQVALSSHDVKLADLDKNMSNVAHNLQGFVDEVAEEPAQLSDSVLKKFDVDVEAIPPPSAKEPAEVDEEEEVAVIEESEPEQEEASVEGGPSSEGDAIVEEDSNPADGDAAVTLQPAGEGKLLKQEEEKEKEKEEEPEDEPEEEPEPQQKPQPPLSQPSAPITPPSSKPNSPPPETSPSRRSAPHDRQVSHEARKRFKKAVKMIIMQVKMKNNLVGVMTSRAKKGFSMGERLKTAEDGFYTVNKKIDAMQGIIESQKLEIESLRKANEESNCENEKRVRKAFKGACGGA